MNNSINTPLFIGVLLLIMSFTQSCQRGVSLSETDFKDMYSSSSETPQPQFKVYHASKEETEIHYMFENRALTYSTKSKSESLMAQVRIKWELFNNYSSKEIIDSSSFVKIDTVAHDGLVQLQGVFTIHVNQGADYILKVTTTNLNNSKSTISFININKTDPKNRQFFKVLLKENNSILFRNYFYKNEEVSIIYKAKKLAQLYGRNYKVTFPVSSPPFSLATPKPFNFDDYYKIELDVINDTAAFVADEAGIYFFSIDEKTTRSGLTLFQYSDDFPEVNSTKQMLDPLRFITSRKEYSKMKKYQDQKKAVDEFWLTTSTDPEKARKLIKGYYNRVEGANYYYTSYKEGWKTDRGIIYTVFGPPSIVYKSLTGESWTYGEQSNYKSLTFNFTKINNPFTNNDYVLQRSTVYKNPWYRAIDSWRQGKVASLAY
tara:strand:+ start:150340 stop:151632 length:1293 start_codon:yes stop_codon:yes gene_type:complete